MLSTVFPDEIISEIMTYWDGHRLGLTCRALLARLSVDNYVVSVDKYTVSEDPFALGEKMLTVSCLPNGIFHGPTYFTAYDNAAGEYTAMYDQGTLKYIDLRWRDIGNRPINRHMLVRGHLCSHYVDTIFVGSSSFRVKIPADDLEQFAREYLDREKILDGRVSTLEVPCVWISSILPQTRCPRNTAA